MTTSPNDTTGYFCADGWLGPVGTPGARLCPRCTKRVPADLIATYRAERMMPDGSPDRVRRILDAQAAISRWLVANPLPEDLPA